MRLSHHSPTGPAGRRRSRLQQGYVLVMFALLLIPLLLVAGLSVDVGLWYNKTADMRKAADAAALAGVVWLPDEDAARSAALATAAPNGVSNGGNVTVNVGVSTVSARRIRVTITDTQVGSFFYQNLGGRRIPLSRTSFAEYTLPVPMGSPRNFFGTGKLLRGGIVPGFSSEELYQSVNTYCSDKVNGDRHQPKSPVGTKCGADQSERRPYELYIEAVEGRPATIDVLLYDPRFSTATVPNNTVVDTVCTYPGWNNYAPYVRAGSSGATIWGPLRYQTWNGNAWTPTSGTVIDAGESAYIGSGVYYRTSTPTGPASCSPVYGTEQPIDRYYGGSGDEAYTFTLYSADNTPLNDNDNPAICTQTFTAATAMSYGSYLGSNRWSRLCQIPTSAPSGRYVLRVENSGTTTPNVDGENNWGLVAKYTNASPGLCDGRNDANCPRVYGKQAISVRAVADTTQASFFLAEIEGEHAGKTLQLELYDPGEGGQRIEIMRPTSNTTWTPATFSWNSAGVGSGANVTSIDVTNSRFNGKVLTIDVPLSGYSPPSGNLWWQIRYTFGGTVNDRTTWSAQILGDPIHLVEEF
jgi:Flp pilus assembly protein TadG